MSILSAILLLFLVIDPLGNIPAFVSILKSVPAIKRRRIVIRELLIALVVLIIFLFTGQYFLEVMRVSRATLGISGGIVLFLISIKMIFTGAEEIFANTPEGEPLVVPLAIPFISGPSSMAAVMLLMASDPTRWLEWLIALLCAWLISGILILFANEISGCLGTKTLVAIERLMGMILTMVSIEMLVQGIRECFFVVP